jgi:hypothetical protein
VSERTESVFPADRGVPVEIVRRELTALQDWARDQWPDNAWANQVDQWALTRLHKLDRFEAQK